MKEYLPFIIIGISTGSIYGLTGTGLVLTYKTSGIFNFAHGSLGTLAVFASPRCCPTAARLTTVEPPPKRTGSNAQVSHTKAENPGSCDTPTPSPWTSDT